MYILSTLNIHKYCIKQLVFVYRDIGDYISDVLLINSSIKQ